MTILKPDHIDTRELKNHSFNLNILKVSTMKIKQFLAIMLLAQASMASGATVYTDETAFLTHLNPAYFLEEFSGYTYDEHGSFPLDGTQMSENYGSVNGYSWTASTVPSDLVSPPIGLFSLPGALSTYAAEDLLKITFTGKPVTALGGIFASTDINGDVVQQTVTINLSDNTPVSFTGSGFRGFTSDLAITYLTIDAVDLDPNNPYWPKLDHLYVGSAVPEPAAVKAVPTPAAAWLLASGLLGLFSLKRRGNIG